MLLYSRLMMIKLNEHRRDSRKHKTSKYTPQQQQRGQETNCSAQNNNALCTARSRIDDEHANRDYIASWPHGAVSIRILGRRRRGRHRRCRLECMHAVQSSNANIFLFSIIHASSAIKQQRKRASLN